MAPACMEASIILLYTRVQKSENKVCAQTWRQRRVHRTVRRSRKGAARFRPYKI